jgi:mono/diheme cytochrome c family protein
MSAEVQTTIPAAEPAEPQARRVAIPVWLMVLFFLLLYWGMVYFDHYSAWGEPQVYRPYRSLQELVTYRPPTAGENLIGRQKFDATCALCHNPDGSGKAGQAPPLVGSDWVLGNPDRLIRIPLSGLAGPIQVSGKEYNFVASMPPWAGILSDDEIAAVLTYIRQSWGNKAPAITPEQVKAVHQATTKRTQPWTPQELDAIK